MNTISYKRPQQDLVLQNFIPKKMIELLKKHNGYVASGAITSVFTRKDINDLDLYFESTKDLDAFISACKMDKRYLAKVDSENMPDVYKRSMKDMMMTYQTTNAISFLYCKRKFQVIKKFTGRPEEIFDHFDFTINMGAWMPDGVFWLYKDFFEDLAKRRLMINVNTFYPISTVVRVFKYIRKGYTIAGTEILKIMLQVHSLELSNFGVLKEQLEGIDTLFLKPLTDFLSKTEHAEQKYSFEEFLKIYDDLIINTLEDEQSEP